MAALNKKKKAKQCFLPSKLSVLFLASSVGLPGIGSSSEIFIDESVKMFLFIFKEKFIVAHNCMIRINIRVRNKLD